MQTFIALCDLPKALSKLYKLHVLYSHTALAGETGRPNYGCQVTVQSEQEKQLMKQYRREEKRNAKREKRVGEDGEIAGEGLIGFDPKELRMQR